MAQENNTARERTALEKLSQDALNQARRERKMIQDTCIAELAQCDTEIPEALEKQVQAEIASLQQAKENRRRNRNAFTAASIRWTARISRRATGWGWRCASRFWTTAAAQFVRRINLPAAAGLLSPCRRK